MIFYRLVGRLTTCATMALLLFGTIPSSPTLPNPHSSPIWPSPHQSPSNLYKELHRYFLPPRTKSSLTAERRGRASALRSENLLKTCGKWYAHHSWDIQSPVSMRARARFPPFGCMCIQHLGQGLRWGFCVFILSSSRSSAGIRFFLVNICLLDS